MAATAKDRIPKKRSKRKVRVKAKSKKQERTARAGEVEQKNLRKDHDKASYELEASRSDRPSRKSTRRGANRVKAASQLPRRQTRRVRSPRSRHAMRGG
jgi:hypothetical protein